MDETPRPDPETGELIIPENPENGIMEPEMAAEGGDVLSSEEVAAIHDTVALKSGHSPGARTVQKKCLFLSRNNLNSLLLMQKSQFRQKNSLVF
jgi:hypothetical protein